MARRGRPPHIQKQSHTPLFVALLFMAVLVGGFVFFSKDPARGTQQAPIATPVTQSTEQTAATPVVQEQPFVLEKKTRDEKNPEFSIKIHYPVLQQGDAPLDSINTQINTYIDTTIKKFKDDFLQAKKDGETTTPGTSWSLTMDYEVPFQSQTLISILVSSDSYTGGAHPNGDAKTVVIDLKNKKILTATDILASDASLKILSDKVMTTLKTRTVSDDDWIKAGAGAQIKNYQNWYLSPKGVTVVFPPYQVAPYAAGLQEVTFPFSQLSSILKSEYILVSQ